MTPLSAVVIQQLITCADNEVKQVAEETGTNLCAAQSARLHWARKFTGLCVMCGTSKGIYSRRAKERSLCQKCLQSHNGKTYDGRAAYILLEALPRMATVLKSRCETCSEEIVQTAGYVLSRIKKYNEIKPIKYCKRCKRNKKPVEPLKREAVPKPVKMPIRPFHSDDRPINHPFAGHEILLAARTTAKTLEEIKRNKQKQRNKGPKRRHRVGARKVAKK